MATAYVNGSEAAALPAERGASAPEAHGGVAPGAAPSAWQGGWSHGTPHERVIFCEVGQSRAVSTSRYRLLYAPRIKPIAKGGTTDPRRNYQANKHHVAYWRPLQLYDLAADANEQRNLLAPAERAALNMSHAEQRSVHETTARLQALLRAHLDAQRSAHECSPVPPVLAAPDGKPSQSHLRRSS